MKSEKLIHILKTTPEATWATGYKIPWQDKEFSRRMLQEHLSQDHELASRRSETIEAQCRWLHSTILNGSPSRILDMGCGPGLYAGHLTRAGHRYRGIDLGPASIEYANSHFAESGRCEFRQGDLLDADLGQDHDLAFMLYGEINVFSPDHCKRILGKAYTALNDGGSLVLETQDAQTVRDMAQAAPTWQRAEHGLFSDAPYLCLTESQWLKKECATLQLFHIIDLESRDLTTYRSTTRALSIEDIQSMLETVGFQHIIPHDDWPEQSGGLRLFSAVK